MDNLVLNTLGAIKAFWRRRAERLKARQSRGHKICLDFLITARLTQSILRMPVECLGAVLPSLPPALLPNKLRL